MIKNEKSEGKRIIWLDVARVLAIFFVVSFHIVYAIYPNEDLRSWGFFGASLFFIISGYTLALKYPKLTGFDIGWFWKRYSRIAAVYYPALIVIYLLFTTQVTDAGWFAVLTHFLFIDSAFKITEYAIISPAWFLVPLMAFYIVYPFVNSIIRRYKAIVLVAFVLMCLFRLQSGTWTSYSPIFFLGEFCFGIALAYESVVEAGVGATLTAFVNPLMTVPYIIFIALKKYTGVFRRFGNVISGLANRTLEIFLFHEAIVEVLIGRWSVFGQSIWISLGITISAILLAIVTARYLEKLLNH